MKKSERIRVQHHANTIKGITKKVIYREGVIGEMPLQRVERLMRQLAQDMAEINERAALILKEAEKNED